MDKEQPLQPDPSTGLSPRARREWYETDPQSVTIQHVTAPNQWRGIQVMRASHRLRRFQFVTTGHVVMLYRGTPSQCNVHRGRYTTNYLQTDGNAHLFPIGETVNATCDGPINNDIYLKFQPGFLAEIAARENLGSDDVDLMLRFAIDDNNLQKIGSLLDSEVAEGNPNGRLFGESLATALAVYVLHKYANRSLSSANRRYEERFEKSVPVGSLAQNISIRRAVEYIRDNLTADLSLSELAHEVGYSPYHLHRLFKAVTGMPMHQYVILARVERAKVLLRTTDLPMTAIATEVGFSDHSHLTRHIKRILGVTPGALRPHAGNTIAHTITP